MPTFQAFDPTANQQSLISLILAPYRARAAALRTGGEAQARAAEISGQSYANLGQSLGQIATGTIGSMAQASEQRKAEQAKAQRDAQLRAVFPRVMSGEVKPEALFEAVGPDDAMAILKGVDAYGKLASGQKVEARDTAGRLALGLKSLPADMRAQMWPGVRAAAIKGGLGDAQSLPEQPTDQYLDAVISWSTGKAPEAPKTPEGFTLSPGQQRFDAAGKPVATVPAPEPKPEHSAQYKEWQDAVSTGYKGTFTRSQTEDANRKKPVTNINTGADTSTLPPEPASQDILSQTGMSINAFRYLTGQASQLPRDAKTRQQAALEAGKWSRAHGVDISALPSQYKAYNDVLASNILRLNNTKIMEQEIIGTVQNLQGVVSDKDLGGLKFANVIRIWAGQEVNDQLAQQYTLHLSQLRNELTAYYGATQGRTGNNLTIEDKREAEGVIKNGISKGSLDGLLKAIENSTGKMGTVMQGSVDRSQKAIWSLFGVGQNYQNKSSAAPAQPPKNPYR